MAARTYRYLNSAERAKRASAAIARVEPYIGAEDAQALRSLVAEGVFLGSRMWRIMEAGPASVVYYLTKKDWQSMDDARVRRMLQLAESLPASWDTSPREWRVSGI